jgi:hypothetical protein
MDNGEIFMQGKKQDILDELAGKPISNKSDAIMNADENNNEADK